MRPFPPFLRWLAFAALADWLVMRTVTRSAIFMPKTPPVTVAYEILNFAGQFAATLSSLLVLFALTWIAWQYRQTGARIERALVWLGLLILSLAFIVVAPPAWGSIAYHLLVLAALALVGWRVFRSAAPSSERLAWALPALALLAGEVYQIGPAVYEVLGQAGPPIFTAPSFLLGELLVVASPLVWWWAYGRGASRRARLAAALPPLAFIAMRLANPAMTGTIAIWSTGLTLYLPWPLYALSLWLAGVTILTALRRGQPAGWALLLLISGGHAPQFSAQLLVGLVGLWVMAGSVAPPPAHAPGPIPRLAPSPEPVARLEPSSPAR